MGKWVQNQQNPPGKKRVDSQGNVRKKFITKRDGSSMIIADGCTKEGFSWAWGLFCDAIVKCGGRMLAKGKPIQ